jgi:hypothetical protein
VNSDFLNNMAFAKNIHKYSTGDSHSDGYEESCPLGCNVVQSLKSNGLHGVILQKIRLSSTNKAYFPASGPTGLLLLLLLLLRTGIG